MLEFCKLHRSVGSNNLVTPCTYAGHSENKPSESRVPRRHTLPELVFLCLASHDSHTKLSFFYPKSLNYFAFPPFVIHFSPRERERWFRGRPRGGQEQESPHIILTVLRALQRQFVVSGVLKNPLNAKISHYSQRIPFT